MAYGASRSALYQRTATYVDKIMKGGVTRRFAYRRTDTL
jgi:hypothetical protein